MEDTFLEIISLENLLLAWREFRRGKRNKPDVQIFERNLEDNLFALHQELEEKTYRHGDYTSFYIRDPKLRLIHKATVRDRVLHHAVYRVLYPIFDKSFIYDSYSCRLKKGTHKAVDRLESFAKKVSKDYSDKCFILKCDVRKFFASVNHEVLYLLLGNKIQDKNVIWLLREIIGSFATNSRVLRLCSGFTRESFWPAAKGLPIGNLTSQLFANIYLNQFDQFIKNHLRLKFYARYTDDFVIVSNDIEFLVDLIPKIAEFLSDNLKMELHPNKICIRKFRQGIDFLGYVILPHYRILRTKTKERMLKNLNKQNLASYLGLLSHCSAFKLKQEIVELAKNR
ncbi:MAG: reverse transcriptase/maturase family protein [Candidatus Berkelbacteria bacterium]|nr:reverse transcriptase/maturase family protein [Candidatus Berkelbacteria bacterium]